MEKKRFIKLRGTMDIRFNDSIGVYEVFEKLTGRVMGNSSDRLHASKLLYDFDGVFKSEPVQLSLF